MIPKKVDIDIMGWIKAKANIKGAVESFAHKYE